MGTEPDDQVWGLAILLGAGSAGAFIYGAFSVTDKLLNGIAIAIIQVISPCSDGKTPEECQADFGPFFGRMMTVFTVLSMILTISLPRFADYVENGDDKDADDSEKRSLLPNQH